MNQKSEPDGHFRSVEMDDVMYIKDLRVQTIIGLYDWERKVRQEVSIDIDIFFDNKAASVKDSVNDTIDYKKITKAVISHVEKSSFKLQESLAESIAVLIKRDHPNNLIRIRVSKPGALRNAKDVGIIIER
ncbi:dihydroneopterin aldolase [Gammaproteobacteria bacterium]|nr:dihydroneopterin aldolase [Gammaproteobacteria bacterium]